MARPLGNTLFDAIKQLTIALFKLIAIAFAWLCKIAGMVLLKAGETIEKMISR
ncbi:MAG TPA: hypothetical protein PLJ00_03290 [Chitinophagales bacterium]|nr:hypothetical protein [Chitinophagales bacterium]HRG26891.1 hypothetical protein [Chitinophagales bacterium]HRG85219.1 hypothetical protein [Chitinophagales bacterium]HRH51815.1 hypothetical protein [Chitinophagales bacterium]